ncbi:hypothetical protein FS837_000466 [Tulasnella sp. UAMH 9824]|nr:hypothetical protein FS837_000466 [Tulasnella sp. UAMH 9824]
MLGSLLSAHPARDSISAPTLRPGLFGRVIRKAQKALKCLPPQSELVAVHVPVGPTGPVIEFRVPDTRAPVPLAKPSRCPLARRPLLISSIPRLGGPMTNTAPQPIIPGHPPYPKSWARLEPAKKESARKAAERKQMEQEWKEEVDRRITAQLMVLGAKYGLEESAKQYAELRPSSSSYNRSSPSLPSMRRTKEPSALGSNGQDGEPRGLAGSYLPPSRL